MPKILSDCCGEDCKEKMKEVYGELYCMSQGDANNMSIWHWSQYKQICASTAAISLARTQNSHNGDLLFFNEQASKAYHIFTNFPPPGAHESSYMSRLRLDVITTNNPDSLSPILAHPIEKYMRQSWRPLVTSTEWNLLLLHSESRGGDTPAWRVEGFCVTRQANTEHCSLWHPVNFETSHSCIVSSSCRFWKRETCWTRGLHRINTFCSHQKFHLLVEWPFHGLLPSFFLIFGYNIHSSKAHWVWMFWGTSMEG